MMFENIIDKNNIESNHKKTKGFSRIKGKIKFKKKKIVKKGSYRIFNCIVDGYEIHNAIAKKRCINQKNLYATFIHGLFDNDEIRYKIFSQINQNYKGYNFKKYKTKAIKNFALHIDKHIDMNFIEKALL